MRYVPDKERVRRWVESSRRAQGLPPTIEDMAFYAQLARILRTAETLRLSEEEKHEGLVGGRQRSASTYDERRGTTLSIIKIEAATGTPRP